ncbi:MAG: hypothetical protein IT168_23340 [Bryobacterales bacterium]|nr:hypothetical protein [Bryobacterales bacterium]
MPTLQIRDLPPDIYEQLVQAAEREHRSLAQQATVLLAKALGFKESNRERRRAILTDLRSSGKRFKFPPGFAPEDLIREDRQR